jgi:hypothetical protein
VITVLVTRTRNFQTAIDLMALFLHFRRHTGFVLDALERPGTSPPPELVEAKALE